VRVVWFTAEYEAGTIWKGRVRGLEIGILGFSTCEGGCSREKRKTSLVIDKMEKSWK
jgi:hypothetical protein